MGVAGARIQQHVGGALGPVLAQHHHAAPVGEVAGGDPGAGAAADRPLAVEGQAPGGRDPGAGHRVYRHGVVPAQGVVPVVPELVEALAVHLAGHAVEAERDQATGVAMGDLGQLLGAEALLEVLEEV